MSSYPPEFRLRVLREVLEEKTPAAEVARIFGVSESAIAKWLRAFRHGGEPALTPRQTGPRRAAPSVEDARRALVVRAKQDSPALGTRRIADVLRRFEGLGVSETTVRRILHEEGLLESRPPEVEKPPRPETRFELLRGSLVDGRLIRLIDGPRSGWCGARHHTGGHHRGWRGDATLDAGVRSWAA